MTSNDLVAKIRHASDVMRSDDNTKLVTKYIEHLSWLLFLKVFDAVEDELEVVRSDYDRVLDGEYKWSNWTSAERSADELIAFVVDDLLPHLRSLSGTPEKELVATIFNGVTTVMKSGFALRDVIGTVDSIDFGGEENVHTLSVIYESLLARFGSEAGWSGEFYTPRPIVQFMVGVVAPQIGQTVYDPASGSAGFLVEAFEFMRKQERTVEDHQQLHEATFYGQESGELPFLLGIMNMILHGVRSPHLIRRNTLEEDVRTITPDSQHDVVLTNPPFGGRENPQIQQNFPIPSQATEILFLQHVMRKVKVGGRAAIVVPEGVMFRKDAFARVKKELLETCNVTAIVSLPAGIFAPYSNVKTNLLFFERGVPTDEIWYGEVLPPEGQRFTKMNPVMAPHLDEVRELIRTRTVSERSWLVPVSEIVARDYDLSARNPSRATEEDSTDPGTIVAEVTEQEREILALLDELDGLLAGGITSDAD